MSKIGDTIIHNGVKYQCYAVNGLRSWWRIVK